MRKKCLLLANVAVFVALSSCSESATEDVINNGPNVKTFLVGTPSSDTRAAIAYLETQNPAVNWEETDQIHVWGQGSTTDHLYSFQKFGNFHNYAAFVGEAFDASKYYLMYPYQNGATFDGNGVITATIPSVQKATLNSFDPSAAVCAGATQGKNDTSVSIKHACAFLKITTTQDCKSVTVRPVGDNGGTPWYMSGQVTLETASSGCAIKTFPGGQSFVKLTADGTENCSSTFPAGTYLMAIITSTRFPGYEISVDYGLGDKNPYVKKNPEGGIQFNAGYIYNLGTAKVTEPSPAPTRTFMVGSASSDDSSETTRAVVVNLESQNPAVNWEESDKIYVWGQGSETDYTYNFEKFGNYHNYAAFTGPAFTASKYYLMYPNVDNSSLLPPTFDGNGIITATIPMCQKATVNSFDPRAAICTGATEGQNDTSVSLKHACAFLKITTTKPCHKVVIKPIGGNGDEMWSMAGEVQIQTSSSGSKVIAFPSGVPEVRLTSGGSMDDSQTFAAGTYLIAVASSTHFPGYDITVDYGLGTDNPHVAKNPEGGIQFNSGYIYNLGIAQ